MSEPFPWHQRRAALIIAHPGHELRVHHWLERAHPATLVLTDGSGRTAKSRLPSTARVLQPTGATPGPIFGRFTDAAIYEVMLTGRHETFIKLLGEVADWLIAEQIEYVAGDALEGYNPSHEICRYLIGAACGLAHKRSGRRILNFDFLLTGRPDECPAVLQSQAIRLRLDDAAIARKLAAAENYPELKHEVEMALTNFGKTAFATEWLRPVPDQAGLVPEPGKTPFYETYGEKQKTAGHYQHVIRQDEHLVPVARALWAHVEAAR